MIVPLASTLQGQTTTSAVWQELECSQKLMAPDRAGTIRTETGRDVPD